MLSFSAFCRGALFASPFRGGAPQGAVGWLPHRAPPSGFAALTHLPSQGEAELSHSNCAA